ncbi:prepilin peptidase [Nitrospirillum pindoramense]|uniref:prepilin peptidase n=1 Tax=Nitrospirillum amazonense TaxID=28077 RepID=UPI001FEC9F97|nr:A24 family peptidase [Nitrospirillum amazonense]
MLTFLPLILIAPIIGSFLGVLVERLPAGRPVAWARSCCDACGHILGTLDLIPIVSFLMARGRCRHCAAPIPPFHLHIELAALLPAAIMVGVAGTLGIEDPLTLWAGAGLGWTLLALALIDMRHMILPDALTLPLVAAGLALAWVQAGTMPVDHAVAAAAGYGGLVALNLVYRAVRGRDGMGRGDAKLLAAGGAWLGLAALPHVLLLSATCGLLAFAFSRALGKPLDPAAPMPFGPCLAFAIWVCWLLSLA